MADRKRRTAPSREFIREREESSRNRRPSRNRYQEEYDSDEEYDDYDDEYEDDYDEDYDDYDEDYEDENFEEEPQSLKRRKSQRQGANIATATGRSDRRRNPSGAENRKAVSGGNSGRSNRNTASERSGQDRGKRKKKKSIFQEGFFADVVALEFNQGNQPTISVCHVKKQSDNIISFLEAHQYACEGLLPLDGDVIIFVGIMDRDFRTESIEAFYVPKGTFVKLNPLIVHGTQYPVDKEDVHIVCILPGRTFKNDMLSRRLETGEQIRITRGCKK